MRILRGLGLLSMVAGLVGCSTATVSPPAIGQQLNEPYGICAHISRGGEHKIAKQEFQLMNEAGIQWVRTDFDWSGVEQKQGTWDFKHLDETVKWADEAGVKILPILDYDVKWASPAYAHKEEWLAYVRKTVSRYQNKLRYWEVWNEENLQHFWRTKPDGGQYADLLKATYLEIKKIDPKLTVVFGGTSRIPYEYIEAAYKAGAKDYFDVMNVHPYRQPHAPERVDLYEELNDLKKLMAKYGDGDKPVWITEIGWPTHSAGSYQKYVLAAGFRELRPGRKEWVVGYLKDSNYPDSERYDEDSVEQVLPAGSSLLKLSLDQLGVIDPEDVHAVYMPPSESFPVEYFDAIESYVKKGGVVVLSGGVPLYYKAYKRGTDSGKKHERAEESYRKRLHIGWEAYWTREGIPHKTTKYSIPKQLKDLVPADMQRIQAERFLSDAALAKGDQMIPLIQVTEKDYVGAAAVAYKLNSDLKGGVIVSSFMTSCGVGEDMQAEMLTRAYLLAFRAGVSRVFWYELQSPESIADDQESHFGILHRDLSPKPAYRAYQTLTRVLPSASRLQIRDDWRENGFYILSWLKPDNTKVWAVWKPDGEAEVELKVAGKLAGTMDHMRVRKAFPDIQNGTMKLKVGPSPLFIEGLTNLQR